MTEKQLREMINKRIRVILNEKGPTLGAGEAELERGLGKVQNRTSKMTKRQRIQAIVPVLQKFGITSADLPMIKAVLSKMAGEEEPAAEEPAPTPEPTNEGSLDSKAEKLDKTQAWQMLQKAVATKPTTQQADFILDLINKFNLDDSVKRRLKMQIKNMA